MIVHSLFQLIEVLAGLYIWTLVAYVIANWLVMFRIINPYQPLVRSLLTALDAIHSPILAPIQRLQYRLLPDMGGLDLSPIVAFIVVQYIIVPILKNATLAVFG